MLHMSKFLDQKHLLFATTYVYMYWCEILPHILLPPSVREFSQGHPKSVPLGTASESGYPEIAEKLLEGGANVNYEDSVGSTMC